MMGPSTTSMGRRRECQEDERIIVSGTAMELSQLPHYYDERVYLYDIIKSTMTDVRCISVFPKYTGAGGP
jgi:hypothetical protein